MHCLLLQRAQLWPGCCAFQENRQTKSQDAMAEGPPQHVETCCPRPSGRRCHPVRLFKFKLNTPWPNLPNLDSCWCWTYIDTCYVVWQHRPIVITAWPCFVASASATTYGHLHPFMDPESFSFTCGCQLGKMLLAAWRVALLPHKPPTPSSPTSCPKSSTDARRTCKLTVGLKHTHWHTT